MQPLFKTSLCICLNAANKKWRQEIEIEPEDRILTSGVRSLEK
jgi:hypothetical protein